MKKGILLSILTLFIAVFSFAQAPTGVPANISAAFAQAMPGVTGTYTAEGPLWKAGYMQSGTQMYMVYNSEAVLQFTETKLTKLQVPAEILANMEARFGNFTFEGVAKREYPDGTMYYEYQYGDGNSHVEVFYTPAGQLTKRNVFQ